MLREIGTMTLLALLSATTLAADYISERKAALDLANKGKNAEAMEAFLKLSTAPDITEVQKSDALAQAILCAIRLSKFEEAMELTKQIPQEPMAKISRMRILQAQRQWQNIVAQFKDEDLASWPPDLVGEASHIRGQSALFIRDAKLAENDLRRASENLTEPNALGVALNALGDTYRDLLKDDTKALESYRATYKTRFTYKQCQAAISAASILRRQGKHAEARKELEIIPMEQVTLPYWRASMFAAYGETYAAQGKKTEAIAKYEEALQVKEIPPYLKTSCEKALQALKGE